MGQKWPSSAAREHLILRTGFEMGYPGGNDDLARLGSVLVPAEFLSARPRGTRSVHISDCVPDQFRTEVNLAEHLQWGGGGAVWIPAEFRTLGRHGRHPISD